MALSGFQALVQSDLSQVVLNPAEAAEPIVYNKAKDGSTRNMNGLVERGVPKEVLAARDALRPAIIVTVANDPTMTVGISGNELDYGVDTLTLAIQAGSTIKKKYSVVAILSQDVATLRLLVQ
jgi:hypothetical protein